MSAPPDVALDALHRFVRQLRARVRLTRAAESCLAGSAIALIVLIASMIAGAGRTMTGRVIAALLVGTLIGTLLLAWRRREWSPDRVVARAEAALPGLRNHLVTALELDVHPERASERIRTHVLTRAASLVGAASLDAVHPRRRARACAGGALLLLLGIAWMARTNPSIRVPFTGSARDAAAPRADASGITRLDVEIAPPAYTGAAPARVSDPERLDVLAGSRVVLRVMTGASLSIALGDTGVETVPERAGVRRAEVTPVGSGVLTIAARTAGGELAERRIVPVIVRQDAPPEVTLEQPRKDLTFETPAGRVTFVARATDDLGLASLTLHYTTVTGSGEQYAFKEGELPLTVARDRATAWRGEATRDLATLSLREGDLLVYYASAADRRPGGERAVSDSYVIEIGKPHAAVAGGFAVPLEEDKSAISLSALIAKTQRTHAAKPQLSAEAFASQTAGLAIEQRMVRSETLFMMGAHGEVENEEEEAEHSHEIQEGRLENRGQADLREATRLMSAAERSLLVTDTGAALVSQRAALAAMQRALSKQRYFLRTLPVRSQIDLTRRLSGDLSEARSWSRNPPDDGSDRRAADAQTLLSDLAAWADAGGRNASAGSELSARLLALDPASPALQAASRDLGRLARPDADAAAPEAREALSRIVSAVRGALPGATPVPAPPAFTSSPLRGALADALGREGSPR